MQETEVSAAATPEVLPIGEDVVPQLPRGVQAARCLQPPPLPDVRQLFAVRCGVDDPDTAGVGDFGEEPCLPPVDGQLVFDHCGPVSEPPVDACLAGLQPRDRIGAHAAVQFGEHRPKHAAPPMCR